MSQPLQRIALCIEFDGHDYSGWQRQNNANTVQQCLEQALNKVEGEHRSCFAAGRTDAGVHAEAMLLHCDVHAARWARSPKAYIHGINSHLPCSIRVLAARPVAQDFHARFDCLERRYRYRIFNRTTASALYPWRHWWMPRPLNIDHMNELTDVLLGTHDFSSFRASGCQAASAVRQLKYLHCQRQDDEVIIDIHADAFLYHMVRNLVGSLTQVGTGSWKKQRFVDVFAAKNRQLAAATAPAHGLYFADAVYPDFCASSLSEHKAC